MINTLSKKLFPYLRNFTKGPFYGWVRFDKLWLRCHPFMYGLYISAVDGLKIEILKATS